MMRRAAVLCAALLVALGCGTHAAPAAKPAKAAKTRPAEAAGGLGVLDYTLVKPVWDFAINHGQSIGEGYNEPHYKTWTEDEKIASIIKHVCLQNALAGAGTGFFGFFGLPAGIAASLGLQVCTVSALYAIHKFAPSLFPSLI